MGYKTLDERVLDLEQAVSSLQEESRGLREYILDTTLKLKQVKVFLKKRKGGRKKSKVNTEKKPPEKWAVRPDVKKVKERDKKA